MIDEIKVTDEWQLYSKGRDFLSKKNVYNDTDKAYRFYNGDQWRGIKSGVIQPITYNIIKPIVKYKTGVINGNGYSIVFSPNNFDDERFQIEMTELCEQINEYISILWEKKKVNAVTRDILKDACIIGEGIIYINYSLEDGEIEPELIDKNNILYENENNSNINEQEYILIVTRKSLRAVRREARRNKELGLNSLDDEAIANIVSDSDTKEQPGDESKEELHHMVTVVTKFYKNEDTNTIWVKKSTREAVIEDERDLQLKKYPIAHFVWEELKGSARGMGEVINLIPNQIEINKTATRRSLAVMTSAYPKLIVDRKKISNPDSITKVGSAIFTENQTVDDVRQVAGYLTPASISSDSQIFQEELINNTQELAGAGDSVTGQINPERASGQAILAVQQSSEQSLTEQVIRFKDFLEDIAAIIFEMWKVYTPKEGKRIVVKESLNNLKSKPENNIPNINGVNPYSAEMENMEQQQSDNLDMNILDSSVGYGQEIANIEADTKDIEDKDVYVSKVIDRDTIEKLQVNIKIDVSPNTPFDKYAREQSFENLMINGLITFEEYAKYLPADSSMPKEVLTNILNDRQENEAKINQIEQMANEKKAEMDSMMMQAENDADSMLPAESIQGNKLPFYNDVR